MMSTSQNNNYFCMKSDLLMSLCTTTTPVHHPVLTGRRRWQNTFVTGTFIRGSAVAETLRASAHSGQPTRPGSCLHQPRRLFPPSILERKGIDKLSVGSFDRYEHLIFLPVQRKWQDYKSTGKQNAGSNMSVES